MQLEPVDFKYCLGEMRPRIGAYGWMWRILRARRRRMGAFPVSDYGRLRRFGNPRRPYFIGMTGQGVRFVGDYRDPRAVAHAVDPDRGGQAARFLGSQAVRARGRYLDVGCGIGIEAAAIARELAGGDEVLAFEPDWKLARMAAATFALNRLNNIRLLPVAIGDHDGDVILDQPTNGDDSARSAGTAEAQGHRAGPARIRTDRPSAYGPAVLCRTLDGLLDQGVLRDTRLIRLHTGVDAIKTLRGAQRVTPALAPTFVFSPSPSGHSADDPLDAVRAAIEAAHYSVRLVKPLPELNGSPTYSAEDFPDGEPPAYLVCEPALS